MKEHKRKFLFLLLFSISAAMFGLFEFRSENSRGPASASCRKKGPQPPPPTPTPAPLEEPIGDEIPDLPDVEPGGRWRYCDLDHLLPLHNGDAGAALNQCFDEASPGSVIEFPAGSWEVKSPILLTKALWLKTKGRLLSDPPCQLSDPTCARFFATANFDCEHGFFRTPSSVTGAVIDHLIFDGNKAVRVSSPSSQRCQSGESGNRWGYNVEFNACNKCLFINSVSTNALCGSSLLVSNTDVAHSTFAHNGYHWNFLWADGVTYSSCNNNYAYKNHFIDNTDVDLIIGGGSCHLFGNKIEHTTDLKGAAYSAINIYTWQNRTNNFEGSRVGKNSIDCGTNKHCGFGIFVGADVWQNPASRPGDPSWAQVLVGHVRIFSNHIRNAQAGIIVDKANGAVFSGNAVLSSGGEFQAGCGKRTWPLFGRSPESSIDTLGEPMNYVVENYDGCIPMQETSKP